MNDSELEPMSGLDAERSADGEEPYVVRTMRLDDLAAVVSVDAKQSGHPRRDYFADKIARCVGDPGINTSLLAEKDGAVVGFLIGRLFFGEFGIPATRAVLDTLGVHPAFAKLGVASALVAQYCKNLQALRVEAIDTLVDWDRFGLLAFFKSVGFRPSRDVDLVWDVMRFPFAGGTKGIAVRDAESDDVAVVAAMDGEVLGERRGRYFEDRWQRAQGLPQQSRFLVADLEGDPAGYLIADLYHGEFGINVSRGVIDTIGVREAFQHHGVASALVQHLLSWLEQRRVSQLETLCRWDDWELLPFFEYVGFRPSARLNLEWRLT